MKFKFFIFFLYLCNSASAVSEKYIYEDRKREHKKYFFTVNGARVSDTVECQKKTCLGRKVASGEIKLPREIEWLPGGVNPTSILCKKIEGEPKVGYMENRNEVSLCYFKDQSFIFGWDLMKISEKSR